MQITKAIFDQIAPNEIFWIVTTRLLSLPESKTTLTYVCVKGKSGLDWKICANIGLAHPDDIARYGDEVTDLEDIRFLCPCDEEVLKLYNQ